MNEKKSWNEMTEEERTAELESTWELFGFDTDENGGDAVSVEEALRAGTDESVAATMTGDKYQTVIIDGDEYDFPIETTETNTEDENMTTRSFGSEYEIEIYGMSDEDMFTITNALAAAGISGDDRDEIGMYLRDGRGNSVYVDPSDVGRAVEIINGLGFQTDEDGNEDSEF